MKRLIYSVLLISLFSLNVFAVDGGDPSLKYRFNKDEVNSIKIKGFSGIIEFVPAENSKFYTVSVVRKNPAVKDDILKDGLEEWNRHVTQAAGVLKVTIESPQSRSYWAKLLGNQKFPRFNIKITGPSCEFSINWLKGAFIANNWKSKGSIDMQMGAVKVKGYEGNLKLWLQSGVARLQKFKGHLFFKTYKAKMVIDDSEGELELSNFMGLSQVTKFNGDINIDSRLGVAKIIKGEGKLDFKLGRANINIDNFKGRVRGKSGQGNVSGTLKGDVDVRVRTQEGAVSLKLPRSGAKVDLGTKEGDLRTPSFLKLTRYSYIKLVKGRLRGSGKGNVFVRTKSGSIKVR